MEKEFDYIIVGGGSAGCVMAARLSEDPDVSVCLVEAGPTHKNFSINIPALAIINMITKRRNWGFETVPQKGLGGRRGYQPRGKVLGGSSGTNAMVYMRGHKTDYDLWADLGNKGWGYDDVLPYFKKSENYEPGENDFHGSGGPLNVHRRANPSPLIDHFTRAAQDLQIPINDDFNGAELEGIGQFDTTTKQGQRWSAAHAFLDSATDRPNLHVITEVLAEKVLLEGKRAVGVRLRKNSRKKSNSFDLMAKREVILSAGAFGSPQLLLLSGIGAADKLTPHNITQTHDLPGVGENLHDHIDWICSYRGKGKDIHKNSLGFSIRGGLFMAGEFFKYRKNGSGMFGSNMAEGGGFLYIDRNEPAPDVQIHCIIAIVGDHGRELKWGHGFSTHICVLRPKSRGTLTLNSADPTAAPAIDPAFLEHPDDMEKLYQGARKVQQLMAMPSMKEVLGKPFYGSAEQDETKLREDIIKRADTVYHPVGSCKMGHDDMAVVDDQLRVHGLSGLRVIDASIMPQVVSGNTNAPTIMIAEKGADMIKADWAAR